LDGFRRLQDSFECNSAHHSRTIFQMVFVYLRQVIVPSRLLSWISISTTKLESLASGGSMDRKSSHVFPAHGLTSMADDREAEIAVLSSHLSQSLSIIQGVALNHDPSKCFLGRKYSLEVSRRFSTRYRIQIGPYAM
jgi:hypothetical protein